MWSVDRWVYYIYVVSVCNCHMNRRKFVATIGGAGTVAIAGCLGGDDPPEEPEVGDWFGPTRNYDGFEDRTDEDEITVLVGTGERGWEFDPPAITVREGTTIVFEWTGRGGDHNVEHADDDWQNPQGLVSEEGHTWSRTFNSPGTHKYTCWPHEHQGMRGAIFVDAYAE